MVSINSVVGETNDSRLNDIRAGRPTVDEISAALQNAATGPVTEGGVGAGTGTVAFGMKGGIGTASRIVTIAGTAYTLGVLVQSIMAAICCSVARPMSALTIRTRTARSSSLSQPTRRSPPAI